MAPVNNDRHPNHTGTIPKTKARNNCNVPQEAVTPTRRDMTTNLVSTSLDWVPVSEYNSRTNYNKSRKPSNNTSDHELTDLDNSVSFESGFGRFVPVRPQPRALPLNVQNRENITTEHHEDSVGASVSGHTLHPYAHQMQNGLIPHSNHAAAAVMIVNPTTPNAVTGNITQQPFNAPNQNRNNLSRNLNPARNNFDGNSLASNNNTTPPTSNSRTGTKTVNIMNNMYDQGQGSFNNLNDSNSIHRESARALGEAIVAACPDAAAVERRLGQIREYIRVTSSLVDTMRNSEDEAFIEHTKEEYDELVEMVMQLKESESKLETILIEKRPDNDEVPALEESTEPTSAPPDIIVQTEDKVDNTASDKSNQVKNNDSLNNNLRKVTNIENEQLNKTLQNVKSPDDLITPHEIPTIPDIKETVPLISEENLINLPTISPDETENVEIVEIESTKPEIKKDDDHLNAILRKNILSCVEKVALIEEMKKCKSPTNQQDQQDLVTRPVSVQSNGSMYSDNELWQNEIKSKMELSQIRLSALKQQQKRLLKYQEEAKQQLDEMNRERQSQEIHPSTSHDNFTGLQNQSFSANYHNPNRMYAANQIGVATTLPHSAEGLHGQNLEASIDNEHAHSIHNQDERFAHRDANVASSEEAVVRDSEGEGEGEGEEDDALVGERGRALQAKLRELQMKKQHMENLVSEFQKLQMATCLGSSLNTYSSSGEDSADEEPSRKCHKSGGNIKNEDPFKLMEIKAIKTALQKTKDLMRSVENYEAEQMSGVNDETFSVPGHSNIHDNKSEGGGSGSMGGWSNEGSVCRVRNSLPHRHKLTNEQQHPQHLQHPQHPPHSQMVQHPQQQQHQTHEANIASLQELAQELRMETEKIMSERARIKDMVSNKEVGRKQKKVNEEVRAGPSGCSGPHAPGPQAHGSHGPHGPHGSHGPHGPHGSHGPHRPHGPHGSHGPHGPHGSLGPHAPGPAERRQMQLRALLADKQRELEALLNKEKVLCSGPEAQKIKAGSRTGSVVNQSYNSELEEPDSRSEQILLDSQNSRETENFRGGGDSALGGRSVATAPSHLGSAYGSDSDTNKSNQRNRARRRPPQERQVEDSSPQSNNPNQSVRHEQRVDVSNVGMVQPTAQNVEIPVNAPYTHHLPPPPWNSTKSNQDMRTNQFTQNSHSQTMDRLLGTPQVAFPPSMPFNMNMNMMMPFGMVGGCACGCACAWWAAWCWQQLALQQRDVHALRDQLAHLEERWRAETASHTLNNQVPPGNRANNYWDNFRSYSRQNLLSANSKTNADGHLGPGSQHNPHPLVERSHNTLHHAPAPKRNTDPAQPAPAAASASASACAAASASAPPALSDAPPRHPRRNVGYERSLSFSSAPDVLNLHAASEASASAAADPPATSAPNVNLHRPDRPDRPDASNPFRNLNIADPIPEIVQAHSNNLNSSKRKSSSKLPAKNSTDRRNYALDYSQTSNVNVASASEIPNPNLASASRDVHDKATSKLFDLLRENVYSEVTALIGVNESHPDFLIQLFRELQLISSDPLRQRVLQSIRNVLSQYTAIVENQATENGGEEIRSEDITTTSDDADYHECTSTTPNAAVQLDGKVVRFLLMRSEETFTPDLLEALVSQILPGSDRSTPARKRLLEALAKYDGVRVCDASGDIVESLPRLLGDEEPPLQDVAGSLDLFGSGDSQLHRLDACPYDMWPGHVHLDDASPRSSQEGKVDLIDCSEMHNGDLAEADQTCPGEGREAREGREETAAGAAGPAGGGAEALPDVVDTDEVTPTEAEAEWLGLDRVPTRLHMGESSGKQKD